MEILTEIVELMTLFRIVVDKFSQWLYTFRMINFKPFLAQLVKIENIAVEMVLMKLIIAGLKHWFVLGHCKARSKKI